MSAKYAYLGDGESVRDSFIFALYLFCMHYHSGQASQGYRILSKLTTQYRVRVVNEDSLLEDFIIKEIYDDLVENFGDVI